MRGVIEMTKDEMKDKISMALKDPVLQQGFEIICKENAELDCQMNRNKYCYSCVNATDRCFRNEIGCPCEKYKSYRDENTELEKENAELREKLEDTEKVRDYWKSSSFDWRHKCTSGKSFKVAVKAQKQLTKATEIIKEMLSALPKENIEGVYEITEEAEQFLRN